MINHRIVKGRVGNGVNGAMVVETQELGRAGEIVVVRAVSRSMVVSIVLGFLTGV